MIERKIKYFVAFALVIIMGTCLIGCGDKNDEAKATDQAKAPIEETTETDTADVLDVTSDDEDFQAPEYKGETYVTINGNDPDFDADMLTTDSYESYGQLDNHGRCTTAIACLSEETQPEKDEKRGDISAVHPTGWQSGQGWERCHLIGWQLCAENDNRRNLVTGTHYMNTSGMLPFENEIDSYIETTKNHVIYEVTPVFEGNNNICEGVHMRAESVEDYGQGISFNVFCFNVNPGKTINYRTGYVEDNSDGDTTNQSFKRKYIININSKKFHYPSCNSVADMSDFNKDEVTCTREELIKGGYSPCGNCQP
ncbi:MAG: DNA/RNA non-specific endonuclease [Bacillota bacterium]|nr:DNA/RNA non-specific endonuclease [Bacillota bacterium]